MLKLAIDAQLPVIAVSTRDTMNLAIVLKHITKKPVIPWVANMPVTPGNLYMHVYTRAVELKLFADLRQDGQGRVHLPGGQRADRSKSRCSMPAKSRSRASC